LKNVDTTCVRWENHAVCVTIICLRSLMIMNTLHSAQPL